MSDYSDIQQELDDFENAAYGEEVRDSMISAIKKIHDKAESAAETSGQPAAVNTASEMEDIGKLYLYLGNESGYQYGYVYAYADGTWTSTGIYGKGEDGYSPTVLVSQTATGVTISVTDKSGTTTATIENGTATDEQVDAWLDEHPEATTTVQDGSITSAKLASEAFDNTLRTDGKIADSKVVGDSLSSITKAMQLTYSANILNPDEAEESTFLNGSTGATSTNPSYFTTGYMPCEEGDVVRCFNTNPSVVQLRTTAFYNSDKVFIPGSGTTAGTNSVTAPTGAKYVRFCASTATAGIQYRMCLLNVENPPAFIPYADPYYVATDEFIGDISIDENTDFDAEYLDYSNVNRLDPASCETGKFINGTSGAISNNTGYYVTNYMPIRSGETIYLYRKDTSAKMSFRTVAAYDKNKRLLPGYGVNDEQIGYTQQGETAFIRASVQYNTEYYNRTPYGAFALPVDNPGVNAPGANNSPIFLGDYTRKAINIYATDTETELIEKLVSAYNQTHCDVIFERATYNISTGLATLKSDYHLIENEIPVGNDCRYFFNGATINAGLDLTNGEIYGNLFGCQRRPSNFELHDGILIATDTRYIVHDEASAVVGSYRHVYDNMVMIYQTSARTEAIRKCIGGGTGASGVVEITGCKFVTDGTDSCVSWHGNGANVVGAEFLLNVRNSWFSNTLRCGELSADQTARIIYTGNSSGSALLTYARWDVTSFLNEVRV